MTGDEMGDREVAVQLELESEDDGGDDEDEGQQS